MTPARISFISVIPYSLDLSDSPTRRSMWQVLLGGAATMFAMATFAAAVLV
jgi:hypothetical protein